MGNIVILFSNYFYELFVLKTGTNSYIKEYTYFRNGGKILNFHTVRCCMCNSVLLNLPKEELERLDSLTFRCESCGHRLILNGTSVTRAISTEPKHNLFKYDLNI